MYVCVYIYIYVERERFTIHVCVEAIPQCGESPRRRADMI